MRRIFVPGVLAVAVAASAAPVQTNNRGVLRIAGTVEAVKSVTIVTPRLTGTGPAAGPAQGSGSLVITKLAPAGSHVRAGDVLVEFDRQSQLQAALDKRAEYLDLVEQIRRKTAEQAAALAKDQTELEQAKNDVERAKLDVTKNDLLPKIEAEKNDLALEQATTKLAALRKMFDLKRKSAQAEIRILEIQRDRASGAMAHSEDNAKRMTILAPFDGLVVTKQVWKGGTMGDVQEGEEVRAGLPIVDVVDPRHMQVRARVNQADIGLVRVGQKARISLDAYPELSFDGRVEQLSPLALLSTLTPKVRSFTAIVSIAGAHPNLMPDLSAAVDLTVTPR